MRVRACLAAFILAVSGVVTHVNPASASPTPAPAPVNPSAPAPGPSEPTSAPSTPAPSTPAPGAPAPDEPTPAPSSPAPTASTPAPDAPTLVPTPQPSESEPTEPNDAPADETTEASPQALQDVTPPAPTLVEGGYLLPATDGVTWIAGGVIKEPGRHSFANSKQKNRLIVSAFTSDKDRYRLVGTTSWVLGEGRLGPSQPKRSNTFTWEPRQQIGQGWTGKVFSVNDFDKNGSGDLMRVGDYGQLIYYPTFGDGRFASPIYYGYGWDRFPLLTSGHDFDGDGNIDILGADRTGQLFLYRGNGAGGFKGARVAYGYGWEAFARISLTPAQGALGPRLVAIDKAGQMFVYEGDGRGGFKGGRTPLGFGWNLVTNMHSGIDWNHDGYADLVATDTAGRLRLYPGNSTGLWAGYIQIGQGWTSQLSIHMQAAPNENFLWSVDRNYRLWRYVNHQAGHVPSNVDKQTGYVRSGYRLKPDGEFPSAKDQRVAPAWPLDANRVPIVKVPGLANGKRIYHPVAYAHYTLNSVENAVFVSDPAVKQEELLRARAGAKALVDGATIVGDEMWFPYGFPYFNWGADSVLRPPWYSGMSQGLALAGFIRLAEQTGEIQWRQYADMILASFYTPRPSNPWFSLVDGNGYLWLDEYPGTAIPSKVINGQMFSMEGIQYYYLITKAEAMQPLFDGAATALVAGFRDYRVPGQASAYCASIQCWTDRSQPVGYHRIVINQLRDLGGATGHPVFTNMANTLRRDRP